MARINLLTVECREQCLSMAILSYDGITIETSLFDICRYRGEFSCEFLYWGAIRYKILPVLRKISLHKIYEYCKRRMR